ncbi:MAG: hypothetical protein NTV49_06365 [Kiritimatiellaeota bacterium]|nr:hypothetical protein [Kiritimatiellota bacterium]
MKRLAWLALFPPAAVGPSVSVAAPSLPELIRAYDADRSDTAGFYDLPWSAVRLDRLERLLAGWQARLEKLDFDALDPAGRVDWLLLENEVHRSLAQLARDMKPGWKFAGDQPALTP